MLSTSTKARSSSKKAMSSGNEGPFHPEAAEGLLRKHEEHSIQVTQLFHPHQALRPLTGIIGDGHQQLVHRRR